MASPELVLSRTFESKIDVSDSPSKNTFGEELYRTVYKSYSAEGDSKRFEIVDIKGNRFKIGAVKLSGDGEFLPGGSAWILSAWEAVPEGNSGGFNSAAIIRLANQLFEQCNIVTLLLRIRVASPLLRSLLEGGFQIAGTIAVSDRISSKAMRAVVPVRDVISREPPCVLIMGRPNPNLLAQARAIARCGVPVYGVLTRGEPPLVAKSSRYLRGVLDAQKCSDSKVGDIIYEFSIAQPKKPVLMFAGDYDLGLAARIWPRIKDCVDAVTDPVAAAKLNDKQSQIDVALKAGIPAPKSAAVVARQGLDAIADFNYPLIGRPVEVSRKGKFEGKVYVAGNRDILLKKLGPVLDDGTASVLIQEYIPGPGDQHYFLLASCSPEGNFTTPVMGRKLLENPKGRTNVGETLLDGQLESLSRRAFAAFRISGVLGVEFKKDERDGTFYYIETNFRPDNFVAIAAASGINLNLMAYLQACGFPNIYRPLFQRHVIWQDVSLVLFSGISGKRVKRAARREPGGGRIPVVDALWASDDPCPAFVWYGLKVVKLIKKLTTKLVSRIASGAISESIKQNR